MKKAIVILLLLAVASVCDAASKSFQGGNISMEDDNHRLYFSINEDATGMGVFFKVDGEYSYEELICCFNHPEFNCISALHAMVHKNIEIDVPFALARCKAKYGFEVTGITFDFELIRKIVNGAYNDEVIKSADEIRKQWGREVRP